MKRNMKKWVHSIIASQEIQVMPVMTYPGLNKTGETILDMVTKGESQYRCIKELSKMYPGIAAMTVMDLSLEAEAFGSPVAFSENEVPTVTDRILSDRGDIEKLKIPEIKKGRVNEYLKAAKLAAENINDRPVFAGCIGPYSLAGRLFDMTRIMMSIILEPDDIHLLLDKVTDYIIELIKEFKETGVNGIIMAEPAPGLLSPEQANEFSYEYVKKIVDAVQDDYFMVMFHNCGNTENHVKYMVETGAMSYHFGNAVDMYKIMPQIPWGKLAFGNLDPASLIKNGTKEEISKETWELLLKTANYKSFVLSSGCDIPPGTPTDNIDTIFNTCMSFNRRVIKSIS
jgi:uroporphyrinogen decarboxylase